MHIEIFDLDGTLTEEYSPEIGDKTGLGLNTYSLWNLITRELAENSAEFDETAAQWKTWVTSTDNIDKIAASQDMTMIGLKMLRHENRSKKTIQKKASEITKRFIQQNIVIPKAIAYLRERLEQDIICLISTAGYEDGALGFIQALVSSHWIPAHLTKHILVSGTEIDWNPLRVTHMNVDENKLRGIEKRFSQSLNTLKPFIDSVFGDDPAINDRMLLDGLCPQSFAIKTTKNQSMTLPDSCVWASWEEIYAHRHELSIWHAQLKQKRLR